MTRPDWLQPGFALWDQDGERWRILAVDAESVELGHPENGTHAVRMVDLMEWIETGLWKTESDSR